MTDPAGSPEPRAPSSTSTTCRTASSPGPARSPRVGVRIGEHVLDLAPVAAAEMLDVHHVFEERSLNALMAEGRQVRASVRQWVTGLLTDETERDLVEPNLVPLADVDAAPAGRGRGLRRLLRLDRPRHERRPDLPARRRGAAAELAAPPRRLPRPGRHRRRLRHARRPADRPASPAAASARPRGSTSRPSSASSSAPARRSGRPCPTPPSPTTSSGSSASTTGRPATSRRGSTSRSARSSASPSPPRSRTGSPRSRRSTRPGSTCPARTPSHSPTWGRARRRASTSRSRWS